MKTSPTQRSLKLLRDAGYHAAVTEHWVTCNDCGAQWSVTNSVPSPFDYERVTEGDGFCEEQSNG